MGLHYLVIAWSFPYLAEVPAKRLHPLPALQQNPKGPRTQIIGFQGPNTITKINVFGPYSPVFGSLEP